MAALLEVEALSVDYHRNGAAQVLDRVDLQFRTAKRSARRRTGSGKSVLLTAIRACSSRPGGSPRPGAVARSRTTETPGSRADPIRGKELRIGAREPTPALNPILPIGRQLADVLARIIRYGARRQSRGLPIC